MKGLAELFKLEVITDNPLFEGFAMEDGPSLIAKEKPMEL